MKCKKCNKIAVSDQGLCKEHFIKYFEKTVENTFKKFKLISPNQKIIVATSGGKDSLTALYLTKKFYGDVEALIIDEGISDYREYSYVDLKNFCKNHDIKINYISFKKEFGITLDKVVKKNRNVNPCTFCGILRRYLLNKYSQNFDVIVLGHNMDDEVQAILMNILRGNLEISSRLGPKTGNGANKKFTQRIKPLYFVKEKEVKIYSFLKGFNDTFSECPYSGTSYRNFTRDFINKIESNNLGVKRNIIDNFLKILPKIKKYYKTEGAVLYCKNCGYPAKHDYCNTCLTLEKYKLLKLK